MANQESSSAWEGDFVRDTITYRLVGVGHKILRQCLEAPGSAEEYNLWLKQQLERIESGEVSDNATTELSGVLTRFQGSDDTDVIIYALPKSYEFFVHFEKEAFQATVAIVHDPDNASVVFCGMAKFTGDTEAALNWSRLVTATLRDDS